MKPLSVRPVRRIVASAPGTVSILGDPSGVAGGCVLSCALPVRAAVTLEAPSAALTVQIAPDASPLLITDPSPRGDVADLVRALLAELGMPAIPCSFVCRSDIPTDASLGDSAAMLAALAGAYLMRQRDALLPAAQAELVARILRERMGLVSAYQDAYGTIFGGLNLIDRAGQGGRYARVLPLALDMTAVPLIVAVSEIPLHPIGASRDDPLLQERAARLAEAGYQVLQTGDWPRLGALMNENHAITSELSGLAGSGDRLVDAALAAGAWGATRVASDLRAAVIALHPRPERLEAALVEAGARYILRPDGAEGLQL